MKQKIYYSVLCCFFISFAALSQKDSKIVLLNVDEFEAAIAEHPEIQLIDVRTPEEFAEGHIENAININFHDTDFIVQFLKLEKNEPIYLYCRSGNRSAKAAKKLEKAGFKKIYDLDGGYLHWQKQK